MAADGQNPLALFGPIGLMINSDGMSGERIVGITTTKHGAGVAAIAYRESTITEGGENTCSTTAPAIVFTRIQIILHNIKCLLHVKTTLLYMVNEVFSTFARDMVAVLAMSVQHAVQEHIFRLEFLNYE